MFGKLPFSIRKLLLPVRKLDPGVFKFGSCIRKFLPRIQKLLFPVGHFCFRFRNFLLSLLLYICIADLTAFFFHSFQTLRQLIHQAVIFLRVAGELESTLCSHTDLRIIIHGKSRRRNYQKAIQASAPDTGSSPVQGHIIGSGPGTHNGKCLFSQSIRERILCSRFQNQCIAYPALPGGCKIVIHQTLLIRLWQTPLHNTDPVHLIRQRHDLDIQPFFRKLAEHIHGIGGHHLLDAFHCLNCLQIFLCHAQSTHHTDVHKIALVIERVRREPHIRLSRPDAGKECHAQSRNQKNRQEPVQGPADFHIKIFSERFLLHFVTSDPGISRSLTTLWSPRKPVSHLRFPGSPFRF